MIVLSIVSFIVVTLVYLLVFTYLFGYYCHEKDKQFGNSLLSKVLVITGVLLSWMQPLLITLDIANSRQVMFSDWSVVYQINYWCVLVFSCVLLPVGLFAYRCDAEDSTSDKVKDVAVSSVLMIGVVSLVLGVSYALSMSSSLPVNTQYKGVTLLQTGTALSVNVQDQNGHPKQQSLPVDIPFIYFAIGAMSCLGILSGIIFGAQGISCMPMDMIGLYTSRPKHRSSKEMLDKKHLIKSQNVKLLEMGKNLFSQEKKIIDNDNGDSKITLLKQKNSLQTEIDEWKDSVSTMENNYEIFKLELQLENVNPCVYVLYLVMGVVCLMLSIVWLCYIIMNQIINSGPSSEFLSYLLLHIEESGASPVAPVFFLFLVYYLNICVVKGYMQMSRCLPRCFTLQMIKKDQTYLDAFLIYAIVLLVNAVAYSNFFSFAFSQYLRGTETQKMFFLLDNISLFKMVFRTKMLGYLFVVVFGLNFLSSCYRLKRPSKSAKQIELEMLRKK